MTKVSFKVSARTARLIGRENIATSKGAIIELVKNGYDADSDISIVYFDNRYSDISDELHTEEFDDLVKSGLDKEFLEGIYDKNEDHYKIKNDITEAETKTLKAKLAKLNSLYIIDSGEGMTQKIIRDHWMTIGTDNKAINVFTKSGKVKAGAKGIGRFALDKLGGKCEMTTVFNPKNHEPDIDEKGVKTEYDGYRWNVDWEDFEGDFKTIDSVKADLVGIKTDSFKSNLEEALPDLDLTKIKTKEKFQYGTILKITDLRESWEDFYVNGVYSDLEVLVPPKESGEFKIYLYTTQDLEKYGEVEGSVCDDYDYKLTAKADENQNVVIKVFRNEYDLETIEPEFFGRKEMKKSPYKKKDFERGYWKKTSTFAQLLPGFAKSDKSNVFNDIGVFDFTFYFLKRSYSGTDVERFHYSPFMSNNRREWLDKFGGVKLFRDNFRVRPYGEVNDTSFDWLGLGLRKSQSQAGIAKKEGGWKVEPENISGAIKISRLTNLNFEDKSSREGLQENKTFLILKQIISSIISELEEDRAYIARAMDAYYEEKHSDRINRDKAEELAKGVLERSKKEKEEQAKKGIKPEDVKADSRSNEAVVLAELNKEKDEEIEKLRDEQKVLRGLASSGIVLASFSHDLSKLNDVLASRVDKVKTLIEAKVEAEVFEKVEDRKNPYVQLEKMKKQDLKLQNWLNFSMGAARKDKRKRNLLSLHKYLNDLKTDWFTILENRGIELDLSSIDKIELRVFEIDFDSIFNNLLVNSFDAFKHSRENRNRIITIKAKAGKNVEIDYYDNGPGLSSDITKPEKIFDPLYTTKRNAFTGAEEGTGLGMWLVKSIAKENDADAKLLFPKEGFGLRLTFPLKFKRK
ncbi:ATP-binding protein [Reichenbachiella sp.]|uniref:ATP-binding protein n=1 Tax=Reichenbachiella sp. TaxID=2184521 RepID=UPI003BB2023E